jgi:hypothetical protein
MAAGTRIELELPEELHAQLLEVARAIGINDPVEAAMVAIAQWVSQRKSELDDRDPNQKYAVNEALDELIKNKK